MVTPRVCMAPILRRLSAMQTSLNSACVFGRPRTQRVANSLRARLLLLLFAAVVITASIQSLIAYRTSLNETNEIFDYQMRQMALSLRPGLSTDGYGSNGFRQDEDENFEFLVQVSTLDHKVLFQSTPGTGLPQREDTGLTLFEAQGTTYKLYTLRHGKQLIQVAGPCSTPKSG